MGALDLRFLEMEGWDAFDIRLDVLGEAWIKNGGSRSN